MPFILMGIDQSNGGKEEVYKSISTTIDKAVDLAKAGTIKHVELLNYIDARRKKIAQEYSHARLKFDNENEELDKIERFFSDH